MKAFDPDAKKLYLYMVKCKSWYCAHCGHVNKLQWIAKVSEGIDEYYSRGVTDWMFCTVTSHPKLVTRGQCLWVEPKAWKKLWSRINYHHDKVYYVYIPELHKNGRVHWHMLISGGIVESWWKKHAPATGFGYMFDSQPVRDGYHSVLYVTKELSKSLSISKWPRNLRRIRTSQNWPQIAPQEDFTGLELPWVYFCQYEQENMETLRYDTELSTGIETIIMSPEK
jgi:hypothetical protein